MKRLKLLNALAFRNLIRQRRRNFLLGVAIAFGTMILILANSFSRGITDTLLNKIVVQMTGHLELAVLERSRAQNLLIRDRQYYLDLLQKNLPGVREVADNVAVFSRAIGNGKGENVIIVPMDFGDGKNLAQNIDAEYLMSRGAEGNIEDMLQKATADDGAMADGMSTKYENPVAVFADKARALNVKLFDTIKVRLKTVAGQEQSARFTVVMLLRSESLFESGAIFLPLQTLKRLRNLRANETGSLQVTFKNFDSPRAVIRMADKIHSLLKPGIAGIHGELVSGQKLVPVISAGLIQDFDKSELVKKSFTLKSGSFLRDRDTDKILVSEKIAKELRLKQNGKVTLRFKSIHGSTTLTTGGSTGLTTGGSAARTTGGSEGRFPSSVSVSRGTTGASTALINEKSGYVEQSFIVSGVFAVSPLAGIEVFLPEAGFYKTYLSDLPELRTLKADEISDEWKKLLAPEFRLLPRTSTGDELQKKNQELRKTNFFGPAIDVRTMYESASQVLELENALNLITLIAVLILFFIILIGVINTLRMTIRERTREIGTMRAIGVQRSDVRNIFIFETFQLAFFSAVTGLVLAIIAMIALSSFTIETQSVLGIFLSQRKLYFVPFATDIIRNIVMILAISTITAYFPSRRAARLDAAEALRHYE